MADSGNIVCAKLYGDLIFQKKVLRKKPYQQAFSLYLQSAGLTVDETGEWHCDGHAYPLAFWKIGQYLVNYKRESVLLESEPIAVIEQMTLSQRLSLALLLAVSCLCYIKVPGAVNLIGRILHEVSLEEALFSDLSMSIVDILDGFTFPEIKLDRDSCKSPAALADTAECFFRAAAKEGYAYAANNLAAREADQIVLRWTDNPGDATLKERVERYVEYLSFSADRYEPYAANRLGLFYATGEVKSSKGSVVFREYINFTRAKEYFLKATVYPDVNSAWAFYNLIKYFRNNYTTNLDLMNEHMDYIKELNPKVYDLAMEL